MRSDESILKRMRSLFNRVNYPFPYIINSILVVAVDWRVSWSVGCVGYISVVVVEIGSMLMIGCRVRGFVVVAVWVLAWGNNYSSCARQRSGFVLMIEFNMGLFLNSFSVGEVMGGYFVVDGVVADYNGLLVMISMMINEALDEVSGVFVGGLVLILFSVIYGGFLLGCDVEVLAVSRSIAIELSFVASIVVVILVETP